MVIIWIYLETQRLCTEVQMIFKNFFEKVTICGTGFTEVLVELKSVSKMVVMC